jgi:hypothetical protein
MYSVLSLYNLTVHIHESGHQCLKPGRKYLIQKSVDNKDGLIRHTSCLASSFFVFFALRFSTRVHSPSLVVPPPPVVPGWGTACLGATLAFLFWDTWEGVIESWDLFIVPYRVLADTDHGRGYRREE